MNIKYYTNKTSKFFSKGIVVSLLLSFVPFFVIVLLNPVNFQEYKISFEKKIPRVSDQIYWYDDLDGDGKEEYIYIYNHKNSSLGFQIYDSDGKNYGQYNLTSLIQKTSVFTEPFFVDLNNDRVKEILFFSQNKDSVYLNIFDYTKLKFILSDRFIEKIGLLPNSKLDYNIEWISAKDINKDSIKELYFSIQAGFGLYPRSIYRYDFANDSLISSPNSGAQMSKFLFTDTTLYVASFSSANCEQDYPYPFTDSCSWIFGFNEKLEYTFDPIPFTGHPSIISSITKTKDGIAGIYVNSSNYGDSTCLVYINHKGKITQRKKIVRSFIKTIKVNGEIQHILHGYKGYTHYFNIEKGIVEKGIKQLKDCYYRGSKDFDHDGKIEHVFYNHKFYQLIITRNDLQSNIAIDLNLRKEAFQAVTSGLKENYVEIIVHTNLNVFFF